MTPTGQFSNMGVKCGASRTSSNCVSAHVPQLLALRLAPDAGGTLASEGVISAPGVRNGTPKSRNFRPRGRNIGLYLAPTSTVFRFMLRRLGRRVGLLLAVTQGFLVIVLDERQSH